MVRPPHPFATQQAICPASELQCVSLLMTTTKGQAPLGMAFFWEFYLDRSNSHISRYERRAPSVSIGDTRLSSVHGHGRLDGSTHDGSGRFTAHTPALD